MISDRRLAMTSFVSALLNTPAENGTPQVNEKVKVYQKFSDGANSNHN